MHDILWNYKVHYTCTISSWRRYVLLLLRQFRNIRFYSFMWHLN